MSHQDTWGGSHEMWLEQITVLLWDCMRIFHCAYVVWKNVFNTPIVFIIQTTKIKIDKSLFYRWEYAKDKRNETYIYPIHKQVYDICYIWCFACRAIFIVILVLFSSFFFFLFFATPTSYGSSQARGRLRTAAASLRHSSAGSEPRLWPTPQLTATPDS